MNKFFKNYSCLAILLLINNFILLFSLFTTKSINAENLSSKNNISIQKKFNKQSTKIGKFVFKGYEQPQSPELVPIVQGIAQQQFIEAYTDFLNNQRYNLPIDLEITWRNCLVEEANGKISSQVNAFYYNGDKTVTLCYGLYQFLFNGFSTQMSETEAHQLAAKAYAFVFFHEIGHALVDLFEIPITGKEEDAVDDFAAFMFNNLDDIETIVLGATSFKLLGEMTDAQAEELAKKEGLSKEEVYKRLLYWDEHGLGEQRYANLLCFVMGRDVLANLNTINPSEQDLPEVKAQLDEQLGEKWGIPPQRGQRCLGEYIQKQNNWVKLIVPHLIPAQSGWNNSPSNNPSSPPPSSNPNGGGCRWGNC